MGTEGLNPAAFAEANGVRVAFLKGQQSCDSTVSTKRHSPIWARRVPDGEPFRVNRREAQTLSLLIQTGQKGFTSGEASPLGWARRTSAYIKSLRLKGLPILTKREAVEADTWVGRYVLTVPVEFVPAPGN
jgi:hypothetical protein